MVVQLLGSAAGGGVPQWNCGCPQCAGARAGLIEKRTQCCIAVSADGRRWFLINASPDLHSQLLRFRAQPLAGERRTPIEAVLLTDADLDHALGLFLLRESDSPITIHTSNSIKEALEKGLGLTEVLHYYCTVRWVKAEFQFAPVLCRDGSSSGLEYKAVGIEGPGPRFRRQCADFCRVFYVLRDSATLSSLVIAPAVAKLEADLLAELNRADAILFDGTFWSTSDFEKSGLPNHWRAQLLEGHLPILNGSLETIAALPAKKKVYIHINNTNPVLWDSGAERKQLTKAGIEVGMDGMEFTL
jgi:pyrroloquinoline quinone biosynthesis protein B